MQWTTMPRYKPVPNYKKKSIDRKHIDKILFQIWKTRQGKKVDLTPQDEDFLASIDKQAMMGKERYSLAQFEHLQRVQKRLEKA